MTTYNDGLLPQELLEWAEQFRISPDAFHALNLLLMAPTISESSVGYEEMSEQFVQNTLRTVAGSRMHTYLWRNNVGQAELPGGRQIRYGLCNESKQVNGKYKSSDLIGGTPMIITPAHVGMRVLVFTAIEVKKPTWHAGEDKRRESGQLRFINAIRAAGGIGFFGNNVLHYSELLDKFGVPHARSRVTR